MKRDFDAEYRLRLRATPITDQNAYTPSAAREFFARLETGLRSLPRVTGVAVSDSLPPIGGDPAHPFFDIRLEGHPAFPTGTGGLVALRRLTLVEDPVGLQLVTLGSTNCSAPL